MPGHRVRKFSSRLASVQSRSLQSGLSTEVQPLENPISGPWGETHHEAKIGDFFCRESQVAQVPCSWALMGSPQQFAAFEESPEGEAV